jgi:hypothetical protein
MEFAKRIAPQMMTQAADAAFSIWESLVAGLFGW